MKLRSSYHRCFWLVSVCLKHKCIYFLECPFTRYWCSQQWHKILLNECYSLFCTLISQASGIIILYCYHSGIRTNIISSKTTQQLLRNFTRKRYPALRCILTTQLTMGTTNYYGKPPPIDFHSNLMWRLCMVLVCIVKLSFDANVVSLLRNF